MKRRAKYINALLIDSRVLSTEVVVDRYRPRPSTRVDGCPGLWSGQRSQVLRITRVSRNNIGDLIISHLQVGVSSCMHAWIYLPTLLQAGARPIPDSNRNRNIEARARYVSI